MAFDVVIIDEAARIPEEAWTDAIQPTLADRNGCALLISTPKGKNWFYREWMRGATHNAEYASFTAPTSDNPNPFIKQAFERARLAVSDRTFRQEWMAEFIEDGGGVFRDVRAAARAEVQEVPIAGHTYVAGLDWALMADFTVLTVMDATTRSVAFTDRFHGIPYELQRERIAAACARFGVQTVIAESNAMGGPNNEMLRARKLPVRDFTTTAGTKAEIIEQLAAAFDNRRITITSDPELIAELQAFETERRPSGTVSYRAPAGFHDDMVMSLALAWYAIDADERGLPGWVRFVTAELAAAGIGATATTTTVATMTATALPTAEGETN
jgi:hypothetical protein